ncbi:MAG: peptidoglycan -binding protein [Pseudomonadota bacterium]
MPGSAAHRAARAANYWPGFVDALATLLMVIVFVLMIFTLFQFYLKDIISGQDVKVKSLTEQIGELSATLALGERERTDLRLAIAQLTAELQASTGARDRLVQEKAAETARTDAAAQRAALIGRDLEDAFKVIAADREKIELQLREIETLVILRREIEAKLAEQAGQLAEQTEEAQRGRRALAEERKLTLDAQTRLDLQTRQVNALNLQLSRLNALLEASEAKAKEQDAKSQVQIADLGRRLNLALASRVEELARYRSEFFGRLREVLGDRADIRVVGDRFVFQSEVLFATGQAELEPEGRAQLARLGDTLREVAPRIPPEINWVLQIDGHTDRRPIATAQFPSNWELSSARAISVVKFLTLRGIPAERLSAAGFGEFQPLDPREDEIGWRRNRRIELKLTSR